MHKDIKALLKRLGLKERESKIYLTCLQHQGLFVHEITQKTRIVRSTVDITVRRLLDRGFLNKVKVGRRLSYMAEAPEALLFRYRQLTEDLEQAVPLLSKISAPPKDMEILYFEGADGFRRVHDDVLLQTKFATGEKKHILSFTSGPDFIRIYPTIRNFIDKRVRNGTWYKAIASHDSPKISIWNNDPKALRAMKYLPEGYHFRIETQIYADSVMLYSLIQPVGGVIIRNNKIADSLRAVFSLLWTLLPDEEPSAISSRSSS